MKLKFAATDGSDSAGPDNIQPKTEELATGPFGSLIIFVGKTYDKNQHQLRLRQENVRFGLQNQLKLDGKYDRIAFSQPKLVDPLYHYI